MTGLIILAIIGAYLGMGVRYVMPFAKAHVRHELDMFGILYEDYHGKPKKQEREQLNREAVWVGIGKSLFWPYVLLARWITDNLVNSMTAEERKASELKEARRVIADYEAEQFAKIAEPSRKWSDFV